MLSKLIHISQLSLDRVEKPTDVVKVGDVVTAAITNIDFENKHVSLSIKEVLKAQAEAAAAVDQPAEEAPAGEEEADAE